MDRPLKQGEHLWWQGDNSNYLPMTPVGRSWFTRPGTSKFYMIQVSDAVIYYIPSIKSLLLSMKSFLYSKRLGHVNFQMSVECAMQQEVK